MARVFVICARCLARDKCNAVRSNRTLMLFYGRKNQLGSCGGQFAAGGTNAGLSFDNALFDRFYRHSFISDEFYGRLNVLFLSREQNSHYADCIVHRSLPDIKHDIREFPAHLPDDRLLHFFGRREGEPAATGELTHMKLICRRSTTARNVPGGC